MSRVRTFAGPTLHTTYKQKTMLNLLRVYTSPNHGPWVKCFTVLTRDPRDPFTFVDPFA